MSNETTSRIEEFKVEVWTPEANWHIPKAKAVFIFPAFGRRNYGAVVKKALANGQRLPTGEKDAFMLDEAYNSANNEVKNSLRTKFVRDDVMFNGWLWVPVVNVWTPNNTKNPGKYGVFDENGEGLERVYTTEELEDRLSSGFNERGVRFSNDRKVSFAPRNTFNGGYHDRGTLSQDGAFISNYGVEGAEKLDKVAENFPQKPYSWIVDNNTNKPIQTLSALGRFWDRSFDGLVADFFAYGGDRDGYVLSVSGSGDSAEGTAPKK